MRLFTSGSAPLSVESFRAFEKLSGMQILERYGMSETLITTSNPLEGPRLPGSVGIALLDVELRLRDDARGTIEEVNVVGELEVRGPNVCAGYFRKPEETASVLGGDGFFRTGDLVRRDGDGYLWLVGRSRDLIITGGENVYPVEVERELDALDGIAESAVIGIPHADFGEVVTAVVVRSSSEPTVGEEELLTELRGVLAPHKIPKRVFFVDFLPRNAMGKVQKEVLRESFGDSVIEYEVFGPDRRA